MRWPGVVLVAGAVACVGSEPGGEHLITVDGTDVVEAVPPPQAAGSGGTGATPVFCNVEGGPESSFATPVSGTIVGPGLEVVVQPGSAHAYLERNPPTMSTAGGYWLVMTSVSQTSTGLTFVAPADATDGLLTVFLAVSQPVPGIYRSFAGSPCSSMGICAYLPFPPFQGCVRMAGGGCSDGCLLMGPTLAPTCQPITPTLCYEARSPIDCFGRPQTAAGSWTVELTSVMPCEDNADPSVETNYYVVHGTLSAVLVGDEDSNADTADVSLKF